MPIRSELLLLASAAALMSGCATQGTYPSLAPRAVERELSGTPAPPCLDEAAPVAVQATPAPVPSDPALAARVGSLLADARRGERAFTEILPMARTRTARSGRSGSEPWIEAQQLVTRLEAARTPTVDALAELESLSIARSNDAATSAEDRERVAAAAQEVRTLADAQRAEIDRLNAALSRP